MRCNTEVSFDIRFIDTKISPDDHPWRMSYTINQNNFQFDDKWHLLYIPLTEFKETGSWDDGTWFNPEGKFDWTTVDNLQLVAEHQSFENVKIWFDNIKVTESLETYTSASDISGRQSEILIFPNPASQLVTINYNISVKGIVRIEIWNLAGQKVADIENSYRQPGVYTSYWEINSGRGNIIQPGLYMCRFCSSREIQTRYISVIY